MNGKEYKYIKMYFNKGDFRHSCAVIELDFENQESMNELLDIFENSYQIEVDSYTTHNWLYLSRLILLYNEIFETELNSEEVIDILYKRINDSIKRFEDMAGDICLRCLKNIQVLPDSTRMLKEALEKYCIE